MPGSSSVLAKKVMVKSSSQSNASLAVSPRLVELQQKIQDEDYINYAIDRIAVVMSRHIVDANGAPGGAPDYF